MRRSQDDVAKTRGDIVETASRLFRAHGIEATSIADVMSAVGMTVGGFYRHFESKDALLTEAIEAASRQTAARHLGGGGEVDLARLIQAYLSDEHRANRARGCSVAALCSEVAREGKSTRQAFSNALEGLVDILSRAIGTTAKDRRKDALFVASAAVGSLVLARATNDKALANELLAVARERLIEGRYSRGNS